MARWFPMIAALTAILGGMGCQRDANPPSRYAGTVSAGDEELLPVIVPQRSGESILAAAAAAPEAAAPVAEQPTGGRENEQPQLDLSSAQAAGEAYAQLVSTNDLRRIPEVLVAEQADVMRPMMAKMAELVEGTRDFKAALDEKFPGHAIQLSGIAQFVAQAGTMVGETKFESVEIINDEEAKVMVSQSQPNGEALKVELTAHKTDDGWRLALPNFTPLSNPEAFETSVGNKPEALKDLARRIQADEFADEAAVQGEVDKIMGGSYEIKESMGGNGTQNTAENAVAQPAANPPPAQPTRTRQRDEVDDVYSGPGMLRNR